VYTRGLDVFVDDSSVAKMTVVAVYLFTFHAYRSWLPARPQGYVRRGKGIQAPDKKMAELYERDAKHPAMRFDARMRETLIISTRAICQSKGWRLHQVRATTTHVHALVSWRHFAEWKSVSNTLKRCLGAELSKSLDRRGPWFSRSSSRKRVCDERHFEYLMDDYLPKHGGAFWSERS
jgi:hypothetical protein